MKNKIIWGIFVLIIIVVGFIFVNNKKSANQERTEIKIGLIAPLTGDLAFIGAAAKNAAELALAELDSQKLKYDYKLIVEDDGFDAKRTASAVSKLIGIDKVDAVISLSSTGGNVVAPIAEQNKLPHIGMASDATVAKGDYNFIHWTQPPQEVDKMIAELQKRNLTKVGMISVNQQGAKAIDDDFRAKAGPAGITVVAYETFNPGIRDFKSVISKVEQAGPEIYLFQVFSPEGEIIAKQIKELGITKPLTSIESFGLSNDPSVYEGQWFVDAAVTGGGFNDSYKAKYGIEVGPTAGNAYDIVNLFVKATENAKSNNSRPSGSEIIDQLSKINDYSGAFGQLTVREDGAFISQASVKIIKDGKSVSLEN